MEPIIEQLRRKLREVGPSGWQSVADEINVSRADEERVSVHLMRKIALRRPGQPTNRDHPAVVRPLRHRFLQGCGVTESPQRHVSSSVLLVGCWRCFRAGTTPMRLPPGFLTPRTAATACCSGSGPAGQLIPICRACRRRQPPLRDGTRATFYVTAPAAQLPSPASGGATSA